MRVYKYTHKKTTKDNEISIFPILPFSIQFNKKCFDMIIWSDDDDDDIQMHYSSVFLSLLLSLLTSHRHHTHCLL